MSKIGSAAKVKLNSFDDLFGTEQPQAGTEQVQEIALSELHEFKGHPFKVLDDEKMQETIESVREHGVLMPGIARPRAEGGYEKDGRCKNPKRNCHARNTFIKYIFDKIRSKE